MAIKRILLNIALASALTLGFTGCEIEQNGNDQNKNEQKPAQVMISTPYADERHTTSRSGIGVALGDVDRDGLKDLVVGTPNSVKLYKNIGNGRFKEEQTICTPYADERHTTSESGISVALGDIDGDGMLDLVVGTPTSVKVYLNKDGKFVPQIEESR